MIECHERKGHNRLRESHAVAHQTPSVETRISCTVTNGYNIRPGPHYYEWCPFCGHRTDSPEDHEMELRIRD